MSDRKVVAIHQPNFFPWMGYFDKIARADLFIFMDNAQFSKTGGTWSNRVKMLVNGKAGWVTMPIVRAYHGVRRINEMLINNETAWREKVLKTIHMNYARTPHYENIYPLLVDSINNPTDSLSEYNTRAIRALAGALNLNTSQFILGSTLRVEGNGTDLLIAMTKAVGGTAYLSGGGSTGYQEDGKFASAGIDLIYQDFKHPVYPQTNSKEFIPGLSVVDALMNCGFEGVQHLKIGWAH